MTVSLVCYPHHRSSKLKISCPSCEAKYSIGDEKVQNRLAKIRCRKCGADIVIDGRVEPPSISIGGAEGSAAAVAVGTAANTQLEFTVDFAENDQRTLSLSDLVVAYNSGQVTSDTFVWAEGMSDWTPLGQVPSIIAALNEAVAPASARSAPVAHVSMPRVSNSANQPQVATARATTKGAGRDLFGKIAHAGSEEDVATAGGYEAHPATPTTGARNESSVLFSLSALTASTMSKPSVPAPSSSVSNAFDDSGLIDLKALASQASATENSASSPLGAAPLGMAPLGGLGSPLGGAPFGTGPSPLSAADLAMPPPKSKTGLFIGGGIALAAIIVAIALALRPEPPPPPQPEPLPLPKPTHTAEPAPEPTPSSAAKPPPTGTEDSSQKAKPKYTAVRRKTRSDGSGTTGSGSEGSSQGSPATPKPASGHCGCSPTDLTCNMKCSAGR